MAPPKHTVEGRTMTFDERNKIHGAIERHAERAGLEAETGGGFLKTIGDVEDEDDHWAVPVIIRIPKRFVRGD
jgi:hypothetical protein